MPSFYVHLGSEDRLPSSVDNYKRLSCLSSLWTFSLASIQPTLLTVATENIFLLLSMVPSCPQDYIQTQSGQGLSCPY